MAHNVQPIIPYLQYNFFVLAYIYVHGNKMWSEGIRGNNLRIHTVGIFNEQAPILILQDTYMYDQLSNNLELGRNLKRTYTVSIVL